ncbi:hypothetical protein ACSSWA_03485 [Melioribacter sp. Ez-97]|uniref:hypothetical protein n=1 Tax=Melioribacter sp. Ez-97 TaxID=3423434 RepID=UPI003ED8FE78
MKFSIIIVKKGKKGIIYSLKYNQNDYSEYDNFIYQYRDINPSGVQTIDILLHKMVNKFGIRENSFKRESPPDYRVYRILNDRDEEKKLPLLRLYCIKLSNLAIIIGGGGIKDESKHKLIENPELNDICNFLIKLDKIIDDRIKNKEIFIKDDGLIGNLEFDTEEVKNIIID